MLNGAVLLSGCVVIKQEPGWEKANPRRCWELLCGCAGGLIRRKQVRSEFVLI